MPLKRLRLNCRARGARGTEKAREMLELMTENWTQLQENFRNQSEEEQGEMIDHFNDACDELGDQLFGEDASIEDFDRAVRSLEEAEEAKFMEAVREALELEP